MNSIDTSVLICCVGSISMRSFDVRLGDAKVGDVMAMAMMMAMVRLNVPSVFLYGGSILPGRFRGKDVTVMDVYEYFGKFSHGDISEEELTEMETVACPSGGSCGGQFTANTMACVSEAIGLALPYSAGTPAAYESRDDFAVKSGVLIMELIQSGLRPRDIVTRDALENAAAIVAATGAPPARSETKPQSLAVKSRESGP